MLIKFGGKPTDFGLPFSHKYLKMDRYTELDSI